MTSVTALTLCTFPILDAHKFLCICSIFLFVCLSFFLGEGLSVDLAVLKLTVLTRLASDSQRAACLYVPFRIKGKGVEVRGKPAQESIVLPWILVSK